MIELNDGRSLFKAFDVGIPAQDLDAQLQRLSAKFHSIADPVIGAAKAAQCIELCTTLEQDSSLEKLLDAAS